MDKRTLQAAALLLGVFALGLLSGVGGTLFVQGHGRHGPPPPPPRAAPPERAPFADEAPRRFEKFRERMERRAERGPPDEPGPGRALLDRLDLSEEQRARVDEAFETARTQMESRGEALGERLRARTEGFLNELHDELSEEALAPLQKDLARLGERMRGRLPPPHKVEEDLDRWTETLPPEARAAAGEAAERFMDDYWRLFREFADASREVRREARRRIGETLTGEQRERLRKEIWEER